MRDRQPPVRIAVVDDHRLLAQLLAEDLGGRGYEAFALHADDPHLPSSIREVDPDLVLLDAVFADDESAGARVLAALMPWGLRVAMLTGLIDPLRHAEFLDAGAVAVITKTESMEDVLDQVELVVAGHDPHGRTRRLELDALLADHRRRVGDLTGCLDTLSDRELATLQALVDGHTVDAIAASRTVAVTTVRSQVRAVLTKLGATSQIQAVAIAARAGMSPRTTEVAS